MDLKEARQKKNLSQEGLAAKTKLTQVTISLIETGKVCPQNGTRRSIERTLGNKINWLKTMGLQTRWQGEMKAWDAVDQDFRQALFNIKRLQRKERKEFLKLAKRYLIEFEEELKEAPR